LFFDAKMETMYTIFNHYLIEITPTINSFYTKLIDVTLPKVINDLFNKKIDDFTEYNYFQENKDELINIQPVCFSVQDVLMISKIVKSKSELFKKELVLTKSAEKICNQEQFLTQTFVRNYNESKKFFLIYNIIMNPEKKNILTSQEVRLTFSNDIEDTEIVINKY